VQDVVTCSVEFIDALILRPNGR